VADRRGLLPQAALCGRGRMSSTSALRPGGGYAAARCPGAGPGTRRFGGGLAACCLTNLRDTGRPPRMVDINGSAQGDTEVAVLIPKNAWGKGLANIGLARGEGFV
jgi:hypothetical protein